MNYTFHKDAILPWLDQNTDQFIRISDQIWANPEIFWEEKFASALLADYCESQGFSVSRGVSAMDTAFLAEFGSGHPIIVFVGEYDALPGLSNIAAPYQKPAVEGGPGHGCGHHMLGVASAAAATAVKRWMEENNIPGTVRYYGTPAEEGGGGKVFMARDGLFNDIDAALTYHPGYINTASKGSCVAVTSAKFRFHGQSAHAGGAPHLGRSALDAVELMNVGANYMREHVLDGTRIQYIITDGGQAPNIVPETAEVYYILRAEKADYLVELADWLRNIARGAALMTKTTFTEQFESGYAGMLPNYHIADLMVAALDALGPTPFSEEDLLFAQKANDTFGADNRAYIEQKIEADGLEKPQADLLRKHADQPLLAGNFPALDEGIIYKGATDVGDLSQCAPTGELNTACFPTCTPGHSWVNTAAGGMSIGHKGMLHAARALALCATAIFSDPALVGSIRAEFDEAMKGKAYQPLIPDGVKPGK